MSHFWVIKENYKTVGKNKYNIVRCNNCYQITTRRKNTKSKSCGCKRGASGKTKPGADKSAWKAYLDGYTRGAKKRGLVWELTNTQFRELTTQDCQYCGMPPEKWTKLFKQMERVSKTKSRRKKFDVDYYSKALIEVNGIDRVDNSLGYITSNCVPCCKKCNFMKHQLSVEDMLHHIKRVYLYNFSQEEQ